MTRRPNKDKWDARRALASLEAVLVTGLTLPLLAFLLRIGFLACRRYLEMAAGLVGWPYL